MSFRLQLSINGVTATVNQMDRGRQQWLWAERRVPLISYHIASHARWVECAVDLIECIRTIIAFWLAMKTDILTTTYFVTCMSLTTTIDGPGPFNCYSNTTSLTTQWSWLPLLYQHPTYSHTSDSNGTSATTVGSSIYLMDPGNVITLTVEYTLRYKGTPIIISTDGHQSHCHNHSIPHSLPSRRAAHHLNCRAIIISNGDPIMANFSRPAMQYSVTFDTLTADKLYTFTIRIVLC